MGIQIYNGAFVAGKLDDYWKLAHYYYFHKKLSQEIYDPW